MNLSQSLITDDNYGIGLILFSLNEKNEISSIDSINSTALRLLKLNKNDISITQLINKLEQYYMQINIKNEGELKLNIYDKIKRESFFSGIFELNNQSIYQKLFIKVNAKQITSSDINKVYMTIDNFNDVRDEIFNKLLLSLPRQFLITMYHELSNKICSLVSSIDSSADFADTQKHNKSSYNAIYYHLEAMKRVSKIFVLCHTVSFDFVEHNEENLDDKTGNGGKSNKLGIYTTMLNSYKKTKVLLDNRKITINQNEFEKIKHYVSNGSRFYLKKLISVIFIYISYKVEKECKISFLKKTKKNCLILGFYCGDKEINKEDKELYITSNISNLSKLDKDSNKNKEDTENIPIVNIVEYIIKTISKTLGYSAVFTSDGLKSDISPFLIIKFNDISISFDEEEVNSSEIFNSGANYDKNLFLEDQNEDSYIKSNGPIIDLDSKNILNAKKKKFNE